MDAVLQVLTCLINIQDLFRNGILFTMRYQVKRVYSWSPDIAYSVGLMTSDGCLQSDGRHIDVTSKDIEQLVNFSKSIGRSLKISPKHRYKSDAYRIQFSDVAYYDFLLQVGLTPRKSHTISKLNIPDKYYRHFLRGLFDGDGTTYGYYDKRWKNSFMYYIGFTSASKSFLNFISEKNTKMFNTSIKNLSKSKGAYLLMYGKSDSYKIYKAMYKNSKNLYLSRKKNKIEGFIKEDNNAIINRNARVL